MFSTKIAKSFIAVAVVIVAIGLAIAWCWPRTDALDAALQPLIGNNNTDRSLVAVAVLDNYKEVRSNAAKWSGVYWGFSFVAAIFSALAGLILKVESVFENKEKAKEITKDTKGIKGRQGN